MYGYSNFSYTSCSLHSVLHAPDLLVFCLSQAKPTAAAFTASQIKLVQSASAAGAADSLVGSQAKTRSLLREFLVAANTAPTHMLAADSKVLLHNISLGLPCRNTGGGPAALPANQAGHHLHHNQPVAQPVTTNAPVAQKVV